MYDIPHADVYYYECASCKKEIKTTIIKTCIICDGKICDTCFMESFCIDHYNLLSAKGKLKFNELVKNGKNKNKELDRKLLQYGALASLISILPLLIFFFIGISIFDFFFIIAGFFIITFITMIVIALKIGFKQEKLLKELKEEKISIFNRYGKGLEILIPKTEKKCENCGRLLKSDSEYCDICGSKI